MKDWQSPAITEQSESYPPSWKGCVPTRIKMLKTVHGDMPFNHKMLRAEEGTEHDVYVNSHGAVSVMLPTGDLLGVRQTEFVVTEWHGGNSPELPWRQAADELHHRWMNGKWPLYSDQDKYFLALALCGEVGELANFLKKRWRGDSIPDAEIRKELADARIYLHHLAKAFDCDLDAECTAKLREVNARLDEKERPR